MLCGRVDDDGGGVVIADMLWVEPTGVLDSFGVSVFMAVLIACKVFTCWLKGKYLRSNLVVRLIHDFLQVFEGSGIEKMEENLTSGDLPSKQLMNPW